MDSEVKLYYTAIRNLVFFIKIYFKGNLKVVIIFFSEFVRVFCFKEFKDFDTMVHLEIQIFERRYLHKNLKRCK